MQEFNSVLAAQNPWWRTPDARPEWNLPLPRPEFEQILARIHDRSSPRGLLLVGPRRVGKTVLLHQVAAALLDAGWPPTQVALCDLEDPRVSEELPNLGDVVETHRENFGTNAEFPPVFLFDEIHASPRWSVWLKKLIERKAGRFVATDSAAAILQDDATESGAGRWNRQTIRFLSFPDFYRLSRHLESEVDPAAPLEPVHAVPLFLRYLERGGFPEYITQSNIAQAQHDLRKEVAELAIEKDLAVLAGKRNIRGLRSLFSASVADSGTMFDASARGQDLRVSRQTVDGWLNLLDRTMLLRVLHRKSRSARKLSRAHPKVYAADPGIVSAFSLTTSPLTDGGVLGKLVETAAHRHLEELAERWEGRLSYYRERDLEADFVLETTAGTLVLEITAGRGPHPRKASALSKVARQLGEAVVACGSQVLTEELHEMEDRTVPEVPLWRLFERTMQATSPEELMKWLQGS